MRIIAGEFRSRTLKTLKGDNTRPTLDKVRESLFHRLGPYFDGGSILDLYGGSGAIALEALSRGIQSATIVEKSSKAMQVIRANVSSLAVNDRTHLMLTSDQSAIVKLSEQEKEYDLIYLDPPYHYPKLLHILELLNKSNLLKSDGICLVECEKERDMPLTIGNWNCFDSKSYGISTIWFYRSES